MRGSEVNERAKGTRLAYVLALIAERDSLIRTIAEATDRIDAIDAEVDSGWSGSDTASDANRRGGRPPIYNAQARHQISAMAGSGMTQREIATALNMPHTTVGAIALAERRKHSTTDIEPADIEPAAPTAERAPLARNSDPDTDKWLTLKEVARSLSVSMPAVSNWIRKNELPSKMVLRETSRGARTVRMFDPAEVTAFEKRRQSARSSRTRAAAKTAGTTEPDDDDEERTLVQTPTPTTPTPQRDRAGLTDHPVGKLLTKEQELELASVLEQVEIDAWKIVLAEPAVMSQARKLFDLSDITELKDARSARVGDPLRARILAATSLLKRLERKETGAMSARIRAVLGDLAGLNSDAERIRSVFVASNQGLVHMAARKRMARRTQSVAYEDLIQGGNLGLMRAAGTFDHRRNLRFATYAMPWIRQSIDRTVNSDDELIRRPVHIHAGLTAIYMAANRIRSKLKREPTDAEVAAELGIDASEVPKRRSQQRVSVTSTSTPIGDGPATLEDRIEDPVTSGNDPTAAIAADQLSRVLRAAIEKLPPREREVVLMRFGLRNDDRNDAVDTLRQIGDALGVSRERIRQLESVALDRLRLLIPPDMQDAVLS